MFIKKFVLRAAGGSLGAIVLLAAPRLGAETPSESERLQKLERAVEQLQERNAELEQEVSTLKKQSALTPEGKMKTKVIFDGKSYVAKAERKREQEQEASAETAKTTPVITAGTNGFGFQSADGNFIIGLHGVLQLDSRTFIDNNPMSSGNDTFLLRRARPILSGTVFGDFDFLFVPDFGGSTVQIFDAVVNYRNRPELQLQVGKFKSPVGLETLQSDVNTTFNERSIATDLMPNRDLGVELHGDFDDGVFSYAVGIFNGAPDYSGTTANSDYDNNKAFAGRSFLQPFKKTSVSALKGLGFGVGGSYEIDQAGTNTTATGLTPGFLTDGQQPFFKYSPTSGSVFASGAHWRIAPQGYYYYGPFSLLGEYVINNQQIETSKGASADLQNTAWEITGGYVLTGEEASYNNGMTPKYPFDLRVGHWGALQLVARYSELNVDKAAFPLFSNPATSASAAYEWALGLNWYLNHNIRVNASYARTTFNGGNGANAIVTKQPEEVFFTRVQLGF